MIGGRDKDVVDVEQQPAAGAADDRGQELRLRDLALREHDVCRGVFEQHSPAERFLRFFDMRADAGERLLGIGQRQQVVRIGAID